MVDFLDSFESRFTQKAMPVLHRFEIGGNYFDALSELKNR